MMGRRSILMFVGIAVVLVMTLIAGLSIGPFTASSPTEGTPIADNQNNGAEPTERARIIVSPEAITFTGNNTTMGVEVSYDIYGYEDISYENVRLCLYNQNGTVLANEPLPNISSPTYTVKTVNVTLETKPTYYIVDHPELRTDDQIVLHQSRWNDDLDMYQDLEFNDGQYPEGFDYPRSNGTGTCG